ncbi:polyadenylate-binding protein-interacting protein 2-like [Cyclopterus lumpus]|uniref:polyadenylate-binding protein-interacting protein 2-like n=1 Tax=Cyclopterus lumpus TaxID=8103 RepID=UPI0014871D43|nr:polyadenylate-binding protein-interacting protein 2-like [Cyclopterus lumpus]
MRDPRLSSGVPPSLTVSTEVVRSGQFVSEDPFAEYLWMEHEEDFNRQVEEELLEEEFMERCLQELLEEEEQWEWFIPSRDVPQLQDKDLVMNSSLNPNAKEFTPGIQKHVM